MRKYSIAFVAVIALVTLGSVLTLAQTANRPAAAKVFGFQDSKGTFHVLGSAPTLPTPPWQLQLTAALSKPPLPSR